MTRHVRTYKILPKPPGGLAYAAALAERYGLTYRAVSEQVAKDDRPGKGEDKGGGLKSPAHAPERGFQAGPRAAARKRRSGRGPRSFHAVRGHGRGATSSFWVWARQAVLSPLAEPSEIIYRQEALADCLAHPEFVEQLYSLATEAVESHKKVMSWGITPSPESLHYISLHALELLLGYFVRFATRDSRTRG